MENDDEPWTAEELAALKARLEFGTTRIVDENGDWLSIAGGIYPSDGSKMSREMMDEFMAEFINLVESKELSFLGSHHLSVEDELDDGPEELEP